MKRKIKLQSSLEQAMIAIAVICLIIVQTYDVVMFNTPIHVTPLINSLNIFGLIRLHYMIGKHDEKRETTDNVVDNVIEKLQGLEKEIHQIKLMIDELVHKYIK
jgi:hypothetical protein